MNSHPLNRFLLAAATCLSMTTPAHAASLAQTVALPAINDGFSYDETTTEEAYFSQTVIAGLSQFDPTLGTLTGISMSVDADSFDYMLEISTGPAGGGSFSADYSSTFTELEIVYNTSDGSGYVLGSHFLPGAIGCGDDAGAGDCNAGTGDSGPWHESGDFTGVAEFGDFIGTDEVAALEIWWVAYQYAISGDNIAYIAGDVSLFLPEGNLGAPSNTFTLTYEYTPVPLPASVLLLAPALAVVIRRRARSQRSR